jgi:hypothetical protein
MRKLNPMSVDLRVFLAQDSDADAIDAFNWEILAIRPLKL